MAAKFHSRPPWSPQDRKLSKEALVLQDYLGRCPTRTTEGLFPLALGYVAVDTPLTKDEILAAIEELSRAKLFDYDIDNEVVLDRSALRINPLRNGADKKTGEVRVDKRIPNAVRLFLSMPDSRLKIEFMVLADIHSPDLANAIRSEESYPYTSPLEAPSKDHASTIEGPSREESSRLEGNRDETSSPALAVRHLRSALGAEVGIGGGPS
jgi:hypothetical protein